MLWCYKPVGVISVANLKDDPSQILNADESGFRLCPKTGKVLGLRGQNVYIVKHGNERENLTVLVTMTADGRLCPPVMVFPYVKPPKAVVESMPPHWILGKSDSGWMRSDVFFEYVANGLNNWLSREGIHRLVLFLVDGHRFHMSLDLGRFCDENSIILYALPPNATHLLQPADVSVFKTLKEYWRQEVQNWQAENVKKVFTKVDFCPIFEKVLKHPNIPKNNRNGFKACGLYSFNPDAVVYSKCVQNKLETLKKNAEVEEEITKEDICSTEKVLMKLKPSLSENGIDVNFILPLVKSLQGNQNQLDESVFFQEDLDKMEFIISDSVVEDNATISSVNAVTKADSKTSSIIVLQNITLNGELGRFSKNLGGNEKVKLSSSQEQGASSNMTTVSQKVVENAKVMMSFSHDRNGFNDKARQKLDDSEIRGGSFEKNLVYPQPLEKTTTSKYRREKLPSAISPEAWRKHYSDKARDKEEKDNAKKKRKLDNVKKKEAKNVMEGQSSVLTSKDQNVKQKCETCEEELDSETEEENEKKVGCPLENLPG
ncbi:hypothetical protein JTB14_004562 [Gonioctena quinquepunctata]|nr:hypothetical protein JTB14_004562 [Gonioctena quinquepunctata]